MILAIMVGVVNVEWHGQDYLHLKWHVVCFGLATPDPSSVNVKCCLIGRVCGARRLRRLPTGLGQSHGSQSGRPFPRVTMSLFGQSLKGRC